MILFGEARQRTQLARADGDALEQRRGAGVPRRTENPRDAGGLFQFPGQRVFASAAADNKNLSPCVQVTN